MGNTREGRKEIEDGRGGTGEGMRVGIRERG